MPTVLLLTLWFFLAGVWTHATESKGTTAEQGLAPIRSYISSGWDTLTRSITNCGTIVDPKLTIASVLYLPAGFPAPAAVQELQKRCNVHVQQLPVLIHGPGEVDASKIDPPGLLYLANSYVVPGRSFGAPTRSAQQVRIEVVVQARVPACGGIATRYHQFAVPPFQLLDPNLNDYGIRHAPGPGDPVEIRLTPRDAADNLFGIGLAQAIQIKVPQGNIVERVVDQFGGSYLITMARPGAVTQELTLDIAGQPLKITVPARPRPLSGCWLLRCLSQGWKECWRVLLVRLARKRARPNCKALLLRRSGRRTRGLGAPGHAKVCSLRMWRFDRSSPSRSAGCPLPKTPSGLRADKKETTSLPARRIQCTEFCGSPKEGRKVFG